MNIQAYGNNSYMGMAIPRTVAQAKTQGYDKASIASMERSGQIKCETCASRQYQDGSDEMVSFKAPGHISPEASASRVNAHEQEHVSNAYSKAAKMDGGRVVRASVRLNTAICPECGRSYVSGGETTTQIKYNESNPYGKNQKSLDAAGLVGNNINLTA